MEKIHHIIFIVFIVASMAGCARNAVTVKDPAKSTAKAECGKPYKVFGKTYYPLKKINPGHTQKGVASWYGPGFHGKKTSSGEVYDMHCLTAAHSTLPLHTVVKVTNLENRKEVVVRVNDRGPFVGDRVIDLSLGAAKKIGMVRDGVVPVRIAVLGPTETKLALKSPETAPAPKKEKPPNPFYGRRGWLASLWGP